MTLILTIILVVDRRSHVSMSIFTSGRSHQYGPTIVSATFTHAVISLSTC